MKERKVKAIAIVLFVLLVLTSFASCNNEPEATTPAEEVTTTPPEEATPTPPAPKVVEVATEAELKEALKEGGSIKITASFDVAQPQEVGKDTVLEIPTGKTITYSSEGSVRLFTVKEDVSLTVKGKGKIDGTKETSRGLFTVYGKLTIEEGTFETVGKNARDASDTNLRGAIVYADTGSEVTINGGTFYAKQYDGAIYSKGKLVINDGKITSNSHYLNNNTRYAYAVISLKELEVNGGEISGIHGGISIVGGTATINDAKVSTFNTFEEATLNASYHAIYIAGEVEIIEGVTIKGGEFTSVKGNAVWVGNNTEGDGGARKKTSATIEGGKFQGSNSAYDIAYSKGTTTDLSGEFIIKGGSFKKNGVKEQNTTTPQTLTDIIGTTNFEVKGPDSDGWYTVVPKATT